MLQAGKNVRKVRYLRFKPKCLAIRVVIYMERLAYIEKVELNRKDKCRLVVKTGGFSIEIAIREG